LNCPGTFNLDIGIYNATIIGMSITITLGKAGRLVVPKAIRTDLGLREGTRLRLEVTAGKFEAVPEPDDVRILMKDGLPVITRGPKRKPGETVKAIKADRDLRAAAILARRNRK
jgi:AbrB family looped-hinge helix DNA binding protein